MAVYTDIGDEELEAFVADYAIGDVLSCKGIAEGVENSNFLLVTDRGQYILTLYERRVAEEDLPFFLGLLEHLAERGIACPQPIAARDGRALRRLADRPAVIVSFLSGMWPRRIQPRHCAELGGAVARLHRAGRDFSITRANALGPAAWRPLFERCLDAAPTAPSGVVTAELRECLARELDALDAAWPEGLPAGVIHADLFPDNVFFHHETLTGLIDFYFACNDFLAYDLAICLNAWCFEPDGAFNVTKARLLIRHYGAERPLDAAEIAALPILARGSAVRFLLTRLYDWLHHPEGAFVRPKDPMEYWRKLRFHQRVDGPGAYGLDP